MLSIECLVDIFVLSQLNLCKVALLYGLQDRKLAKLQIAQNPAARIITRCRKCKHMKLVHRDLHWLPIEQLIWYKIALLTFKALHGLVPVLVSDLIKILKWRGPWDQLQKFICVHHRSPKLNHAFAAASPNVWNSLPSKITDTDSFKGNLKFTFNLSFHSIIDYLSFYRSGILLLFWLFCCKFFMLFAV